VRGVVLAAAGPRGRAGLAFDDETRADRTLDALVERLREELAPKGQRKIEWVDAPLPDGSGRMRLPKGWRITSAWQGAVDVLGDKGETMTLGYALQVVTPAGNWGAPAALTSPLVKPTAAKARIFPQRIAFLRRQNPRVPPMRIVRILEAAKTPWTAGGQAAYMLWSLKVGDQDYLALSLVGVQPTVSAPAARFREILPVLLEAWGTWKVADRVLAERRQKALESMRATTKLIREAHAYRQEVFDESLAKWTRFRRTRHRPQKATVQLPNGQKIDVIGYTDGKKAAEEMNWRLWKQGIPARVEAVALDGD